MPHNNNNNNNKDSNVSSNSFLTTMSEGTAYKGSPGQRHSASCSGQIWNSGHTGTIKCTRPVLGLTTPDDADSQLPGEPDGATGRSSRLVTDEPHCPQGHGKLPQYQTITETKAAILPEQTGLGMDSARERRRSLRAARAHGRRSLFPLR